MNNHIFLSFIENSKVKTRLQVSEENRYKGLFITYVSCADNVVTEFYDNDVYDDASWGNDDNWKELVDCRVLNDTLNSRLSWYKA